MSGFRLNLDLPDYLLPEGWGNEPDEQEVGEVQRHQLKVDEEASILSDDTLTCLSGLSTSMTNPTGPFPCLADELEQQAKDLERDWLSPFHTLKFVPSPRQPRLLTATVSRRSAQLPHVHTQSLVSMKCERSQLEEQPTSSNPPATPTKRSHGLNSSWNESNGAHSDPHEVQSPARPLSLLAPQQPVRNFLPPLSTAVDNAGAVRLGRQTVCAAAWRGCLKEPWCNREARHRGPCNHRASVPGLMAYSQNQLFESGVNVDELCRAPELMHPSSSCDYASLHAASERQLLGDKEGSAQQGKRKAEWAAKDDAQQALPWAAAVQAQLWVGNGPSSADPSCVDGVPAVQEPLQRMACGTACPDTLSGHSGHVSSAEEGAGCSSQLEGTTLHKRQRVVSCTEDEDSEEELVAEVLSSGRQGSGLAPSHQAPAQALPCIPEEGPALSRHPSAAPASQHAGVMPYHRAGAPRAVSFRSKALARSRGVRISPSVSDTSAAAPEAQPLLGPSMASASPGSAGRAVKAASTPAKVSTRQLPKTPDGAVPVVRSGQRRVILHWNSDQVVDPRSGKLVSRVDPATFCTQCSATHTPVWRAGPFGHKTLCNACGVRYMKFSKNKK